ncbi:MAG: hypothetical protein WAM72_27925 [Xanthobacteraceae bacterium]
MSERRFVLADFTYMDRVGLLRLYEAGRAYRLPRAIAHAATKRELVAKERPAEWIPPNMFQLPKVLTEAEVIEAEEELKPLQRHAFAIVDPKMEI